MDLLKISNPLYSIADTIKHKLSLLLIQLFCNIRLEQTAARVAFNVVSQEFEKIKQYLDSLGLEKQREQIIKIFGDSTETVITGFKSQFKNYITENPDMLKLPSNKQFINDAIKFVAKFPVIKKVETDFRVKQITAFLVWGIVFARIISTDLVFKIGYVGLPATFILYLITILWLAVWQTRYSLNVINLLWQYCVSDILNKNQN